MNNPTARHPYRLLWSILTLSALAVGLDASISHAQQAGTGFRHDAGLPIEIVSDSLEITKDQETAVFQGNVNAVQGRMSLRADLLKVKYRKSDAGPAGDASPFSRIDATGNVVLTTPAERATGDWAVYQVDDKTVTLGGVVVLTRGDNTIRGRRLVVNLATGQSKIDSGEAAAGQQRVRAVFTPKKKSGTP